jgi:vacuolar-type H+-ATPase subunit B/Vma2
MVKEPYFPQAIQWAQKRGLNDIKANWEDYETPSQFSKKDEETPFIPDITGSSTGGKVYVEIALKTGDIERSVSKWKLISTLASMKGGKFFLLAPKGHKTFVSRMLEKYRMHNAQVVDLQ